MPDPPPPPPGEDEEIEVSDLAAFVGRSLLDINTNFFGIVRTRTDRRTGRTVYWLSDPNTGRAQDLRTGATLVDPSTRAVTNVSASTTGSAADSTVTSGGKLSEADLRRLFGEEDTGGGGGYAPLSYSSSQAAQTQQEQFEQAQARRDAEIAAEAATLLSQRGAEQDRLDREARAEQNRIAEEAALKRQRLGTLTDLIQSFMGAQSQARDTLANLQPDPFRFAAVAGGVAPFGATPQQGFQQQLQQFAGAAVPSFDPSGSAASLEPVIAQLTGAQAPTAPGQFGMAGGGTVPTPFNTMSARMVGEKGPEVMVTSPQGVTILPLAKGAAEGGFFPFQPIEYDKQSMFPALTQSGIFGDFNFLPRAGIRSDQSVQGLSAVLRKPLFEKLGIRPSFVSPVGRDEIFYVDPTTGMRRLVTGDAVSGIQPRSVAQVENIGQFGRLGGTGIGTEELNRSLTQTPESAPSPFTRFSAPLIEPTTGTLLPAPFMVAQEMNQLRVTNPGAFNLLLNAYELAGAPAAQVLSTIQSSLSFGQARGSIGLR